MNRKNFFKSSFLFAGLGIAGMAAFLESCQKNNLATSPQGPTVNFTLDLTQSANAPLLASGGSVASNGVVIANTGGTYAAIAQTCTHSGCSLGYNANGHNFVCPCHGGTFDINGNVVSGPPPSPVKKYAVVQNGNVLTVSG